MQLADLHRQSVQSQQEGDELEEEENPIQPLILCPFTQRQSQNAAVPSSPPPTPSPSVFGQADGWQPGPKIYRSRSAPRLDVAFSQQASPSMSSTGQDDFFQKMPRRLRFFYFWARTRIFQRLIIVSGAVNIVCTFVCTCAFDMILFVQFTVEYTWQKDI